MDKVLHKRVEKAGQSKQQAWRLRCTLEERTSCQKTSYWYRKDVQINDAPEHRGYSFQVLWTMHILYTVHHILIRFLTFLSTNRIISLQVIWIWRKWFPIHSVGGFIWNRARITWSLEKSRVMRLNGWILTKGLILLRKFWNKFSIRDVKNALVTGYISMFITGRLVSTAHLLVEIVFKNFLVLPPSRKSWNNHLLTGAAIFPTVMGGLMTLQRLPCHTTLSLSSWWN